jgi:hypothetical protein
MAPSKKTLTAASPTLGCADRRLVAGYEQLRRRALGPVPGEPPGPGWMLLLDRGLRAWMEACARLLEFAPVAPGPEVRCRELGASPPRAELVGLLAGLLLARASRAIS